MLEAGASVSILHTRTQKTQISDLPQIAETSPYRRKERNDTADQKSFIELGRAGALSGSTYHPPLLEPGRKSHFTSPKKQKTTKYNILFKPTGIKQFVMVPST